MRSAIAVAIVMSLATPPARAQVLGAQPGDVFDYGTGARTVGMGGAQTASGGNADALYYNPGALGLMSGSQVEMTHAALYGGAIFDSISYAQSLRRHQTGYAQSLEKSRGAWGVEVVRLGVGSIGGRDKFNNPTANFGYSETGFGAGVGYNDAFISSLSLGLGAKVLQRSLAGGSNQLMGLDLGALYGPFFQDSLRLGLTIRNAVNSGSGTGERMSTGARLGAAWHMKQFEATADISEGFDGRIGLEYSYGAATVRSGYSSDGASFGGGLALENGLSFDVAFLQRASLGYSERFSMAYRFGAPVLYSQTRRALEILFKALDNLKNRDYLRAAERMARAIEVDPNVGEKPLLEDGHWRFKAERLRALVSALDLGSRRTDPKELTNESSESLLAYKAINEFMAGHDASALLLAEVATGESVGPQKRGWYLRPELAKMNDPSVDLTPQSVYIRLAHALSKFTRLPLNTLDFLSIANFTEDRNKKIRGAMRAKNYRSAVDYCLQITLISPDSALAWERLGSAYYMLGDHKTALDAYNQSLLLEPENPLLRDFIHEHYPN